MVDPVTRDDLDVFLGMHKALTLSPDQTLSLQGRTLPLLFLRSEAVRVNPCLGRLLGCDDFTTKAYHVIIYMGAAGVFSL